MKARLPKFFIPCLFITLIGLLGVFPVNVNAQGGTSPVINEFVFNHTGTDAYEYIEIFGQPNTDYSNLTLVVIEGDGPGSGLGFIDAWFVVGTTNASGYWVTPYQSSLENGTQTLLLVSNYTNPIGAARDTDTNNDGVIDSSKWTAIIDSVGVSDNGASDKVYSESVLSVSSTTFAPGGASRIPNGTDTNIAADWTINHFDGQGLPCYPTCGFGAPTPSNSTEALNTPGSVNLLGGTFSLVINEIDYVQSGNINSEAFVEIRNNGTSAVSLTGLSLVWVQSTNLTFSLALSGSIAPNDYYVLCETGSTVADCDQQVALNINTSSGSVAIRNGNTDVDRVGYGGTVGETTTATGTDDATVAGVGISRFPDGVDTNHNGTDIVRGCITPGATNTNIATNCVAVVNASIAIDKAPDTSSGSPLIVGDSQYAPQNGTAAYAITLTNTGEVELTDVTVSDALAPACDLVLPTPLGVGESHTYTCQGPVGTGDFANLASVTATAPGGTLVQNSDTTLVVVYIPIYEIQGAGRATPYAATVTTIGVVTGIKPSFPNGGFFLQDIFGDSNDATSDGIFAYTRNTPTVSVGDLVVLTDFPFEFNNMTEFSFPTITPLTSGYPLPAPVIIGQNGRQVPSTTFIDNDNNASYDHAEDPLDFYESLEGMLVAVENGLVVGPTNGFGEFVVVPDNGANATQVTPRGGLYITPGDFNPERVMVDDAIVSNDPLVNVGASFVYIEGPLDYTFGNYKILNTAPIVPVAQGTPTPEVTALVPTKEQLTVASYNVENLYPGDAGRFDDIAAQIVNNLAAPDIIALQEVQDNTGPTNNGVVSADQTYLALISAIEAAGGPTYDFREIAPENNEDGGQPGGNIRVGFLFNPDRVEFVDRGTATATTANAVELDVNNEAILSYSPGRIDPTNTAFDDSRKVLAGEFLFRNNRIMVMATHFNSKGGDDALFGETQPPMLISEIQRNAQAAVVNNFVDSILGADPDANIIVLGDTNDFWFSNPMAILKGGVLTNLFESLPEAERYSYIFDGNSQNLDNLLVSDSLLPTAEFDAVHGNSELAAEFQVSDHDPLVARFELEFLPPFCNGYRATIYVNDDDMVIGGPQDGKAYGNRAIVGTSDDDVMVGSYRNDKLRGVNGNDMMCGEDGNDDLIGNNGDDLLIGGDGRDSCNGNGGDDAALTCENERNIP